MSSINIQTENGLIEIGGKVTEEKIISALGYTPADKEDLIDNIIEDESGELSIADESGNVVMSVGTDGVHTTEIIANGIEVGKTVSGHISDGSIHVTAAEKETWNTKSDFSGFYQDLQEVPNITENESGNLVINDNDGNIVMQVDSDGLETTTVTAKSVVVNGVDVETKLDENAEDITNIKTTLSSHIADNVPHITSDERALWTNKSDFSGYYNDLENAPNITEDNSGEVSYADNVGNVIAKISSEGLETTKVIVGDAIINGASAKAHIEDNDIHITSSERTSWNNKATTEYVDTKVANLVNSAPEALDTLDELAAALGDDANFATTVTNSLAEKASKTDLNSHTSDTSNPHSVTKSQVGLGNVDNTSDIDKPVSAATQTALNELKTELSESIVSEAEEWKVVDNNGNIVATINADGLETTTVTAKTLLVNGADIETALNEKALASHNHTVSNIADLTVTATELNYMDGVTSNVQTQLDSKVPVVRTINGKALSENVILSSSDVNAYSKTEIDDKTWTGTKDEYVALGTYSEETIYYITDDSEESEGTDNAYVSNAINAHNSSDSAHSDMRTSISNIQTVINSLDANYAPKYSASNNDTIVAGETALASGTLFIIYE